MGGELDGDDREGLRLMMQRVFEGLKQERDGRLRLLEHLALIAGLEPSDRDTATRSLLENLDDVERAEFWASADAAEDSDGAIDVSLVYDEVARRAQTTLRPSPKR